MKTITTVYLDVNKTRDLRQYDVRQGDKDSREFHIILTENGQPITLTSGMSATADAVVRNVIVAQGEALTVDTANQYIVMTLTEEMLTLAGNMKIDVKVSESGAVLTAATLVLYVGAAVINENTHIEPGGTTIGAQIIALNTRVDAAEAEIADAAADVSALQATLAGIEATNTEISGEILSFNYQGETVRKISVAASGASSSVLTVCGKNIYPKYTSGSQSNLSWTVAQDGTITFSGTPSADVLLRLQNLSIPAAGKELTLAMFNNMTSARLTVFMVNSENSANKQLNLSATNATLTATHTYDLVEMRIRIPKDIDWTGLTLKPMLVYGSSAGNFEAYSGQSHNVTLSGGVVQEDIPLHNGVNTVWASNGDTAITFAGQSGTVTGYVAAQINSIQNQFYRCAASGGAKYVYVYFKSGDYYVCYELHNVPSAASNSDTWQLGHTTACKIASDGTISDVVELIDGGEYELAMRENGAADYCGGNNHGDENTVTFKLFADGKQISDFSAAADGKLRPFNRIDAFDISLVDRCDTPGDNIAQHQKHWTFENGKVEVQQSLKFLQNLRLDVVLLCMCCARRDQFPYGIRQGGVAIEDMSSGGFPHLTTRSNDISYFYFGNNATMNIKAKTDSPTISALYINDVTNAQRQQNKLYYGYYQATNSANPTSVSAGDVIQETSVYDIAYMAATE